MSADNRIPNRTPQPATDDFLAAASLSDGIEVEGVHGFKLLDGTQVWEVCTPIWEVTSEPSAPDMFSVYLRKKKEHGGLAQCIADFCHPEDAVVWAQKLGAEAGLAVDIRFDLQAIEKLQVGIGENVIVLQGFNALCGRITAIASDGRATMSDCHDLFGPTSGHPVWVSECRRFWEKPRTLSEADIFGVIC